jgi:hypothetical protein
MLLPEKLLLLLLQYVGARRGGVIWGASHTCWVCSSCGLMHVANEGAWLYGDVPHEHAEVRSRALSADACPVSFGLGQSGSRHS